MVAASNENTQDKIEEEMKRAKVAVDAGNYDDAIRLYEKVLPIQLKLFRTR